MLGVLLALLITLANCESGTLSQYDQRPTDRTLHNRTTAGRTAHTLPEDWREAEGFMAGQSCEDIGQWRMVYWRGHSARVMIFDCPGSQTSYRWMTHNNILGELDYYTARAWDAQPQRGLTKATVCKP